MVLAPPAAVERLPPHNLEAEQSLLGSLLLDRDAIIKVASFVRAEDFYQGSNGIIYQAILDLYNRREPTDFITLSDELTRREHLDRVGGIAYLSSLLTSVPTAVHVEYYGKIVERTAVLRRLIDAGSSIVAIGYREGIETEDALDAAERAIFTVSEKRTTKDFQSIAEVLDRFFDQIDYMQQHRGDVVGVATGYADLDQLTGGLQRSDLIILAARPSMGKCLTARTLIDDPETGERLTIEEGVRRRLRCVFGVSTSGELRPTPVSDWIDSGVQPCVRVTTRTGRAIEVTTHHPFLTVRGWRPIGDLRVGDRIGVPRGVPAFGQVSPPPWLVRLLAYYAAEGGLTDRSPEFTNTDPVIVDDFLGIIRERFPEVHVHRDRITYVVGRPRRGGGYDSNPVTRLLREHGLWGKGALEKRLPSDAWCWDRPSLALFLRVLVSCDGTVYRMSGYPRVGFTVASEHLARDVHHAFTRFGIVAKLWRKTERSWRVEVTDPASVARYVEQIGWIGQKGEREFRASASVNRRSNTGHASREIWETIREACGAQGLSLAELGRRSGQSSDNLHANRGVPSRRLARYAAVLDDDRLRLAASEELYWDEIVAVEDIGEHQVYDLTVPDGSNFVAADVCVHNTAFALGMAHGAALQHGKTVGIFSLEMSAEQLVQRLLSTETGVDSHRLRLGHIDDGEWDRISRAFGRLAEASIYIDDSAGAGIMDVRSKARRLQAEHGLDLIIVDYLQLMSGRRSENRVQEISEISRGLKGLARELNVPVVALSQLSRAVETRADHKPMLSDLRESGSIEQDADIVMFIYREEKYDENTDKKGIAEIVIAKHRNGPVGSVNLRFFDKTARFADLELYRDSGL
jgi:replicative DNA helicase